MIRLAFPDMGGQIANYVKEWEGVHIEHELWKQKGG